MCTHTSWPAALQLKLLGEVASELFTDCLLDKDRRIWSKLQRNISFWILHIQMLQRCVNGALFEAQLNFAQSTLHWSVCTCGGTVYDRRNSVAQNVFGLFLLFFLKETVSAFLNKTAGECLFSLNCSQLHNSNSNSLLRQLSSFRCLGEKYSFTCS